MSLRLAFDCCGVLLKSPQAPRSAVGRRESDHPLTNEPVDPGYVISFATTRRFNEKKVKR